MTLQQIERVSGLVFVAAGVVTAALQGPGVLAMIGAASDAVNVISNVSTPLFVMAALLSMGVALVVHSETVERSKRLLATRALKARRLAPAGLRTPGNYQRSAATASEDPFVTWLRAQDESSGSQKN